MQKAIENDRILKELLETASDLIEYNLLSNADIMNIHALYDESEEYLSNQKVTININVTV
jgi:hypothetical protein